MQFSKISVLIHKAGTVQSWLEEHKSKLEHLPWPAQLPDLNIVEPFWSVLDTRVRNRFPPLSLKQLEDVLREEWYKIPLETSKLVQISPFQEGLWLYLRQKVFEYHINNCVQ
jgi:hypothetical protein